jgi:integrase
MNFYLNRRSLLLRVSPTPGDTLELYLNIQIDPKYWSSTKQIILTTAPPDIYQYNTLIDQISKYTKDIIFQSRLKGTLMTSAQLKKLLTDRYIKKVIATQDITFTQYAHTHWLKNRNTKGNQSKLRTILQQDPLMDFPHFTVIYLKNLANTLSQKYKPNTVNKLLKILNSILREAKDDGIYQGQITTKHIPATQIIDHIYLTENEVTLLYNYTKTTTDHTLANAAKLWLIMYHTACRYQNIKDIINPTNIIYHRSDPYIRYKQIKTNKHITIPLHSSLVDILDQDYKIISNQKLNEYIKHVAQAINLPHPDQVTCHTARRSCITNLVLMGMPLHLVMKVSGHSTEKELMRYVKYNDLTGAVTMQENPVFIEWSKVKNL